MSGSTASSAPPRPAPATTSAAALRRHPIWAAAAGQSSSGAGPPRPLPKGKGKAKATGDEDPARFERISLLAAELQANESDSDDQTRPGEQSDERDFDSDVQLESDDEEDDGVDKAPPKKKPKQPTADDFGRAAAFGARPDVDAQSEASSFVASRTSSKRRRDAEKEAFPVPSIRCVGCSLGARIRPVEDFVFSNIGKMSERALWRFASLTWQREVVEKAAKEGVDIVPWSWREISLHFKLHCQNPIISRSSMVSTLTAMRLQAEGALVRNEGGERSLDKGASELILKILAAESKERQLLAVDRAGGKKKTDASDDR